MTEKDPYEGLPSLERMERDMTAAEGRLRPQGWFSRNRRRLGAAGVVLAVGYVLSPIGPAYGLYDGDADWEGPGVASDWECASATAVPAKAATLLVDCKNPPVEVLEGATLVERDARRQAPRRGVTLLLEDGEDARLPTFEDLSEITVPVSPPGEGAPASGPTGPSGVAPASRPTVAVPPLSRVCQAAEKAED